MEEKKKKTTTSKTKNSTLQAFFVNSDKKSAPQDALNKTKLKIKTSNQSPPKSSHSPR